MNLQTLATGVFKHEWSTRYFWYRKNDILMNVHKRKIQNTPTGYLPP